jgi:DNA-directed RNA polymerase subunit M/transcription elongation factor TFIIS
MSYRNNGIKILSKILKNEKNIEILDKCIFHYSDNREEYLRISYEVVEMINQKVKLKIIINKIKTKQIGIFSDDFKDIKQKIDEEESFIIKPFEIEEGVLECGKCGSKKTYSYTKQTRSGDESTTVFAVCCNCNNKWKT